MKAVLFARVSSKEQEETGYSLPAQEKLLKEYATRKGCLLYTSPSPRDKRQSRMPSSA